MEKRLCIRVLSSKRCDGDSIIVGLYRRGGFHFNGFSLDFVCRFKGMGVVLNSY